MKGSTSQGDSDTLKIAGQPTHAATIAASGLLSLPGTMPSQGDRLTQIYADALSGLQRWQSDTGIYCVILQPGFADSAGQTVETSPSDEQIVSSYGLVWAYDRFPKPTVALLSGNVRGLTAAMSLIGTHRVAGAGFEMVADDVRLGRPPGFGLTACLARLPAGIGTYLVLSGRPLSRADAWRHGLITHCVDETDFDAIKAQLADADCVDPILDSLHRHPGPEALVDYKGLIERAFCQDAFADIITTLDSEQGPLRPWAQALAQELSGLDPQLATLSISLTRRPQRHGMRHVLEEDQRVALHAAAWQRGSQSLPATRWLTTKAPSEISLPERDFIPSVPV